MTSVVWILAGVWTQSWMSWVMEHPPYELAVFDVITCGPQGITCFSIFSNEHNWLNHQRGNYQTWLTVWHNINDTAGHCVCIALRVQVHKLREENESLRSPVARAKDLPRDTEMDPSNRRPLDDLTIFFLDPVGESMPRPLEMADIYWNDFQFVALERRFGRMSGSLM